MREVRIHATNYDGADHWRHAARLVRFDDSIVITETAAGVEVMRGDGGTYVSPFNTRAHYWTDRWFNVIRLQRPGETLDGFYCNIATPASFDGETVRYVDLQLDLRVFASEAGWAYELWDEDDFEAARERYAYPDDVIAHARAAVDELITMVESRAFPFDEV